MTQRLFPNTEAEIADYIKTAHSSGQSIEIQGGGTRSGLGRPVSAMDMLSTRALSGISSYDPGALNIVAAAGTPVQEIEDALSAEGQYLPFEPMDHRRVLQSSGTPTIGAVVAGNISGPRRIQKGACRDSLIGVRFVNGTGDTISSGGRVMKNVTGYDLVKLMCGSWGTLGVITEVSFKVLPRPERTATLRLTGLDIQEAISAMQIALNSPCELTGAAYTPGPDSQTLLRVEGFSDQVDYRLSQLKAMLQGQMDIIENDAQEQLWRDIRDAATLAHSDDTLWRVSIAPSDAPDLFLKLSTLKDAKLLFDWGGGLVWVSVSREEDALAVRNAISAVGGHASLIRGSTHHPEIAVLQPQSARIAQIERALRAQFDPKGILNPGRMAN